MAGAYFATSGTSWLGLRGSAGPCHTGLSSPVKEFMVILRIKDSHPMQRHDTLRFMFQEDTPGCRLENDAVWRNFIKKGLCRHLWQRWGPGLTVAMAGGKHR